MSCNSCAKSYSLLRKEKGCPGCGFSYCSKCLNDKIFLPKLNAEAKVCSKCKKAASYPNESKTVIDAPDAYYRRIGVLDNKNDASNTPTSSMHSTDQHIQTRLLKLKEDRKATPATTTDEEIRNRLQNIKGDVPTASDADIQERLAKLRGVPIETIRSSKPVLLPPDTRTEQEQANDLLKQYMEQTTIDTKYNDEFEGLISDMELRMQKLRGNETSTSKVASSMSQETPESEDEEESVRKIVEKIKAEATLEEDEIPSTADELPFCEICNEDATMRCLGCKYLFCKRCFHEHKDDDDGCNRYEPYKAPKKQ